MTTTDPTTDVTPPADPDKTSGGLGTDGQFEGNGTTTTTQSDDGTDGQHEGNGPQG